MSVKQVHGIMACDVDVILQRIQIIDFDNYVTIFHTGQKAIKLNADNCRYLAKCLVEAAKRLDERVKK